MVCLAKSFSISESISKILHSDKFWRSIALFAKEFV